MPGTVRPVTDERDGLLAFLAQQRYALRISVHGLTDEQAAATPAASSLCLGGLVKHAARTERQWIVGTVLHRDLGPWGQESYDDGFRMLPGETLQGHLDDYARVADETEHLVADLDLGAPVPVPPAPWNPSDVEAWSVRWVLLHLIEETAKHAGHADIIRESLDGKTFYALLAATEGTPDWYAEEG